MAKYFARYFATLVIFLCSCPVSGQTSQQEFTVGVILPLSGQNSSLGNYLRRAMELAVRDLRAQGRLVPRLVFEDDRWEQAKAVSAFQIKSLRH